ncbi:glutathione peroxidase [Pseudoxanthomonas sp. JBR18]|uniref:glutathione peroxidase n=1 Tax=Pseudoxanthomonas sp. JBR18 TaxID=2969308 RepID=UPI002306CD3B|nr:glutathione peroxidase [Pseudoxanthomonas sp. JBR18]WCE04040.1 glutathione peroxidase [Pseudoxanthomonas sp. JBR18]
MRGVFEYSATDIHGREQPLAEWAGSVLLIVNVASRCGFTPQYGGLELLWQQYRDRGLVVMGFPCNQFGQQEPGDEAQIHEFCGLNYAVTFPMFSKVQVNGADAHPLWKRLQHDKPGLFGSERIKWNFTKFLIGRNGQVVKRYGPRHTPSSLAGDIERALG